MPVCSPSLPVGEFREGPSDLIVVGLSVGDHSGFMSLDRWPGQFGTWLMTWVAGFSGAFLRWLWQRIFKGLSALKKLRMFFQELRVGLSELSGTQ